MYTLTFSNTDSLTEMAKYSFAHSNLPGVILSLFIQWADSPFMSCNVFAIAVSAFNPNRQWTWSVYPLSLSVQISFCFAFPRI